MICARSEVGLSRLPVTEEIAGSNPVERATDIFTLIGCFFMENIPFLLHFCTIYVIIWSIGLEGLRSFYNKISDNVRGRIPSVMVRNREQFNPSDSEKSLSKKIMALVGATAFALGAAGCSDSESYRYKEPTPDATTSTSQEYSDPTIDSGDAKEPVPQEVLDMYEKMNGLDELKAKLDDQNGKENIDFNEWRESIAKFVNENISDENDRISPDQYGPILTDKVSLGDDLDLVIKNQVYSILYLGTMWRDSIHYGYPLSDDQAKTLRNVILETNTLGQAKYAFSDTFSDNNLSDGKNHPDTIYEVPGFNFKLDTIFKNSSSSDKYLLSTDTKEKVGYDVYEPNLLSPSYNNDSVCINPFAKVTFCTKVDETYPYKESKSYRGYGIEVQRLYAYTLVDDDGRSVNRTLLVRAFVKVAENNKPEDLNTAGNDKGASPFDNNYSYEGGKILVTPAIGALNVVTKEYSDQETDGPILTVEEAGKTKFLSIKDIPEVEDRIEY